MEHPSDNTFDKILKKYESWLDAHPVQARCVVGAVTSAIGAWIGSRRVENHEKTTIVITRRQWLWTTRRNSAPHVDWLQVLDFAIHGGLVAGPLSYFV
jgi:hypothetical protein